MQVTCISTIFYEYFREYMKYKKDLNKLNKSSLLAIASVASLSGVNVGGAIAGSLPNEYCGAVRPVM